MKRPYYYLLLIAITVMAACSKNVPEAEAEAKPDTVLTPQKDGSGNPTVNPPVIVPGTGTIAGFIFPAFAYSSFTLTLKNTETDRAFSVKPDAKGQYQLTALPPGNYQISIQLEQTTLIPITVPIQITAGTAKVINFNYQGHPSIPAMKGTGSISGTISPAGPGAAAAAYSVETNQRYDATIDASGAFLIRDLPAGTYSVSVGRGLGYTALTATGFSVTLAAGEAKSLSPVLFSSNADPASAYFISYELDGLQQYRKSKVGAEYDNSKFHLYTYSEGTQQSMSKMSGTMSVRTFVVVDRLDLLLDDVKGLGTYVCKGTAESNIKITQRKFMGMGYGPPMIWSTTGAEGTATISITAIDPVNRTISGSFSATLVPENALAKGNKTITKGTL